MSMNAVKVKRVSLLEKVKENREGHRSKFLEAQEGFKEEVIKRLEQSLEDARKGKRFVTSCGISAPQDMTPEYDTIISMLEMSVDEEIEITQSEFKCYVLDQWSWKHNWETSNTGYMKSMQAE